MLVKWYSKFFDFTKNPTFLTVTLAALTPFVFSGTPVPLDVPRNSKSLVKLLSEDYLAFRMEKGYYPQSNSEFFQFQQVKHIKNKNDVIPFINMFKSRDNAFATPPRDSETDTFLMYVSRPNSTPLGGPLKKGEVDYVFSTDIYAQKRFDSDGNKYYRAYSGFYITIADNGIVEKVPIDRSHFFNVNPKQSVFQLTFPSQAGIPFETLSYEETELWMAHAEVLPLIKPLSYDEKKMESEGAEPLVMLSRSVGFPNEYGIDREKLWQIFDPKEDSFSLQQLEEGATKLGLSTSIQNATLLQLDFTGSPAVLFLKDDGRQVVLTALDDDRAVIIDRGVTHIAARSVLEERYGGEALVPTKALTQNAAIVADDAVREVKLPSSEAEVPQQFVLRNTGATPITLQLEYPLLGVTESKLSRDVIAPGETAKLDLKVKWRSILKAPYQNVLVSIQTNDPIVPRLQLAILLTPPKEGK